MAIKFLSDNPVMIIGAILGGLAGSWSGAIVGGFIGLVVDEVFRKS